MPRNKAFDTDEVLQKAMQLFWKQGYHATSIQELVDYLGINRASMYDTFGDKMSLFDQAFGIYYNGRIEKSDAFLKNQPPTIDGLKNLFLWVVDDLVADPDQKGCFVVNTVSEFVPNDKRLQSTLLQIKQRFEKVFHDFLLKCKDAGNLTAELDLTSIPSYLYTTYSGLMIVAKVNPNHEELTKLVDNALGVLNSKY